MFAVVLGLSSAVAYPSEAGGGGASWHGNGREKQPSSAQIPDERVVNHHAQSELKEVRRYMLYCRGLRFGRRDLQMRFWLEHLGIGGYECGQ